MGLGGPVEGGLEELVEFWLRLASRSAMRRSIASRTTRMAACAAAGTVLQSASGMGGARVITLKLYRHWQLPIPDRGRLGGVLRLLNDLTIQGDGVSAPNCEPLERQRLKCAEGLVND